MLERARALLPTVPGDALRTAPLDRFGDVVSDAALVAIARDALGAEVEPFGCTFVVKPARTGLPVLWHQDGHPWEQRGITGAVTLGVALDDSTRGNGCLLVVPGSHRLAARPLTPVDDPPNVFGAAIDPAMVDESAVIAVELRAGDVSVHHPNLIHGSDANRSDGDRVVLVLRYRVRPAPATR